MDREPQVAGTAQRKIFARHPHGLPVGRVGALAVALGVGLAVAGPAGTAAASPSTADSPTGSADSASSPSASGAASSPRTPPGQGSDSEGTSSAGQWSGTADGRPTPDSGTDGSAVSTSGGAHVFVPHRIGAQPQNGSTAGSSKRRTRAPADDTEPSVRRTPSSTLSKSATTAEPQSATGFSTHVSGPVDVTAASASVPAAVPPSTPPTTPIVAGAASYVAHTLNAVRGVLASLFGAGGGPSAPVSTPALWVVAAAARRELTGGSADLDDSAELPVVDSASVSAVTASSARLVTAATAAANRAPAIKKVTVQKPNQLTGAVTGKVSAADADKDTVTYSAAPTSVKGGTVTIVPTTGAFTYTPSVALRHAASRLSATDADTTDTITVSVSDGKGGTAWQSVVVAVAPQNTAPTLSVSTSTGDPGTGATKVTMTANDADGDIVGFFGIDSLPPGDIVWGNGITQSGSTTAASFVYTPSAAIRHAAAVTGAPSSARTVAFTVQVQDSYGGLTHAAVVVPITAQNAAPTVTSVTADTPNSKGVVTGKAVASDADADQVTFSASSTTKGKVSINAKTGAFTYTPTAAARHAAAAVTAAPADKTDTVTIVVNDGHGGTRTATVTVTLLPKNSTPKIKASAGKANTVTGVVTGKITGSDTDKDTLAYTAAASTGKGTVTVNAATGAFTYTPTAAARIAAGAPGASKSAKTDTFTVTATDAHGATVTKTVTVSIAKPGPNSAPTISNITVGQPDSISGTVGGSVSASDVNGDALTYSLGTGPTKGAVSVGANGAFTYTPTASQRSTTATLSDSFTVNVSDGTTVTTTSVSVPVAPIPSQLVSGQTLSAGQYITSSNGRYKLVMQGDGNLVLYDNQAGALWSTGTNGRANVTATMQGDGNFVLYSGQTALWSTKTNGFGGARLVVQDDANAVVYQGSTALWDRHAGRLNTGGGGTSTGLAAKVAAFVAAFQGQVWGEARYGTKAYTDSRSMTNVTSSPYYTPDMVGECVSLVTQFLKYAFGITPGAWGDADNWQAGRSGGNQMAANGFSWHTDKSWQNGDILVYSSVHIGIYYNGQLFDSNDAYGARGSNGLGGWAARHAGLAPVTVASGYVGYWRKNS